MTQQTAGQPAIPRCRYQDTDRQRPAVQSFPAACSEDGRARWMLDVFHFCEAHGSWHAKVSPFAGYRRIGT